MIQPKVEVRWVSRHNAHKKSPICYCQKALLVCILVVESLRLLAMPRIYETLILVQGCHELLLLMASYIMCGRVVEMIYRKVYSLIELVHSCQPGCM